MGSKIRLKIDCNNASCDHILSFDAPVDSVATAAIRCSNCQQKTRVNLKELIAEHNAAAGGEKTSVFGNPKQAGAKASPTALIRLECKTDQGTTESLELPLGKHTVGRGDKADFGLQADDKYMSRVHFEVYLRWHPKAGSNGEKQLNCIVKDAGSTNGTFLVENDGRSTSMHKHDEVYLEHGQAIKAGKTEVTVHFLNRSSRGASSRGGEHTQLR